MQMTQLSKQEISTIINTLQEHGYTQTSRESLRYNDKPLRLGIYGIAQRGDSLLMVETQSGSLAIVNFPGGGADENETIVVTLTRECQEEIGCSVTMGAYKTHWLYQHPDFSNFIMLNLYYMIELKDEPCGGIWIHKQDFKNYTLLPPDREVVRSLFSTEG